MNTKWLALAYWLVDVYALASVVLAVALVALWSIRQPARRLAVARWTLRVLLCVPLLAFLTKSTGGISMVPEARPASLAELCECNVSGAPPSVGMCTLAAFFVTASGLVVAWLALGALATMLVGRRSHEAPAALRTLLKHVVTDGAAAPRLRVGGVSQPAALGLFRPTIVLPAPFVEAEPQVGVEAALAHEWAHLRRGDLWTLAMTRWLFVLFFAHPLFYVLRGRIRLDQEVIADAEAARLSGEVAYAEVLVGWARLTSRRSFGPSLSMLGRPSILRARVALLLDPDFRVERTCPRAWIVTVRAVAAALLIGLGVLASTGMPRTALSAIVPLAPPIVSHTHESNTSILGGPPGAAGPRWSGACMPEAGSAAPGH